MFQMAFHLCPTAQPVKCYCRWGCREVERFFVKVTVGVSRRIHIRGVENVQNVCILRVPESRLWDGECAGDPHLGMELADGA